MPASSFATSWKFKGQSSVGPQFLKFWDGDVVFLIFYATWAPQYKAVGTNKKQLQKSEPFPTSNPEMVLHAFKKKSERIKIFNFLNSKVAFYN